MEDNKTKFDHRINAPEPHIVALIGEIDGIKGEFKGGLRMTPQAITSLKRSVLVTSAGASTRIEGSKLEDVEVEKVMQGLSVSKLAERDYQEVQGYLETLQNVFDGYQTLSLREGMISSLHNELLKYSDKDKLHKGGYKKGENTVGILGPDGTTIAKVIFDPTPAWQTPAEMAELVDWTFEALEKNRFHPLLVIANFLVEFLKIHPFEDGNGRLSRVLTNLLLLRSGYQFVQYVSHEQIVERRKDEYYLALRKSQETFKTAEENPKKNYGDTIAPWLNFFLGVVREQAIKALTYLKEEHIEDTLSPKQYEVWKYISGVNEANLSEIEEGTGIVRGTIRQSIERLLLLGKIRRIGRGRGTRYIKAM
jgi:Fic family protein